MVTMPEDGTADRNNFYIFSPCLGQSYPESLEFGAIWDCSLGLIFECSIFRNLLACNALRIYWRSLVQVPYNLLGRISVDVFHTTIRFYYDLHDKS